MYAGLQTADTDEERADVLVRELERTRASERKVLVIVPTTGTGWINPVAARALELMYNGDTQWSDRNTPICELDLVSRRPGEVHESGRTMIDAVHDWWARLPSDRRPKLVLYGESLGSMAGQGAFNWLPDIARMGFSSVLWVGPPNAEPAVERRSPCGATLELPEVEPRYDNGRTVRFSQANDAAEIAADTDEPPWDGTRVLFIQHPSDPVVWWSPDLMFNRPPWLKLRFLDLDWSPLDEMVPDRHVLAGLSQISR